jgi:hypothetical protein
MSEFYPPVDTDCPECGLTLQIEITRKANGRMEFKARHEDPDCPWMMAQKQSPRGGAEIAKRLGLTALEGLWVDREH